MSYPPQGPQGPHPQQPYGQAQPGPPPAPYHGPAYPQQMPPGYGQPMPYPQQPMQVQQVGHSVTKPAWTCGEIVLMFFTMGLAYPIIWMRRRAKTTVTRHR